MTTVISRVDLLFQDFLVAKLEKLGGNFESDGGAILSVTYLEDEPDPNWFQKLFRISTKQTFKDRVRVAWVENHRESNALTVCVSVYSEKWLTIIHPILEDYEQWMSGDSRTIETQITLVRNFKKSQLVGDYFAEDDTSKSSDIDNVRDYLNVN